MKRALICIVISIIMPLTHLFAQNDTTMKEQKMKDWREIGFGMFIHWGIYSELEGVYKDHHQATGGAEWIMNRMKIPVTEYQDLTKEFNPVHFNADDWVRMAKEAGMKYMVFTAKHHDGFAMYDSDASKFNIVDATPYKKDVLKDLAEASEKQGIDLGIYYSQAQDWSNPGGSAARKLMNEGWPNPDSAEVDDYTKEHQGHWDPKQTTKSMDEYIDGVAVPQVRELLTNYGDFVSLWWDTPVYMKEEYAEKLNDVVMELQPNIITNDRLVIDSEIKGDYITPEQEIPKDKVKDKDFEVVMTMNNTWGYRNYDHDWKSVKTLVRNLIDIRSKGGNYLLNVGPKPDGTFPQASINILEGIRDWMEINSESIYGVKPTSFPQFYWGRSTMKKEGDHTVVYLYVFDWPEQNKLVVPDFEEEVDSALLLTNNKKLKTKKTKDSLEIELPKKVPHSVASVIKVKIKGELEWEAKTSALLRSK